MDAFAADILAKAEELAKEVMESKEKRKAKLLLVSLEETGLRFKRGLGVRLY